MSFCVPPRAKSWLQTFKFHSPVSPDPLNARSGSESHPPSKNPRSANAMLLRIAASVDVGPFASHPPASYRITSVKLVSNLEVPSCSSARHVLQSSPSHASVGRDYGPTVQSADGASRQTRPRARTRDWRNSVAAAAAKAAVIAFTEPTICRHALQCIDDSLQMLVLLVCRR